MTSPGRQTIPGAAAERNGTRDGAGPAAPPDGVERILIGAPAIRAEAREELLVVKADDRFLCARPDGDIRPHPISGEGFYDRDTRHLSEMWISLGEARPVPLSRSVESGHCAVVYATNPTMADARGAEVPQETINLRRRLLMAERLYHGISLHNFNLGAVVLPLTLWLQADFADVFEVRGVRAGTARGRIKPAEHDGSSVRLSYTGQDGEEIATLIELDPPPLSIVEQDGRVRCDWEIELEPGGEGRVLVTVGAGDGADPPRKSSLTRAAAEMDERLLQWTAGCTSIEADNELVQGALGASVRDLHALLTETGNGPIPAAGIPWYVAPFGRDSLITAYESLMLAPGMARDTLRALAALQSDVDDPWRDAEPGKILHEQRAGELARAGLIPHTPYFGTVDATPLFVLLAAAYYRWAADLETLSELRPALDRALEWIDRHGDLDGDGFIEYSRRSPAGLLNQGWKDSEDALVHADGSLAEGPIALVEVQGYVYIAKLRIAEVYEALGEPDRGRALRAEADDMRARFNEAFWMPDEGYFALALDGRKRQVASVTSNPGHCLYCGIVDDDKAAALAARLMAPDMFNGWGVRTLSAKSPAYNPMSYHNGSVWPHDNAIIAAGLKRYGYAEETQLIAGAIFDIAARARDFRLAELYCGFDRGRGSQVVDYPVACMPQAWAAAVPFMLLQAMLGVSAHAPSRSVTMMQPNLPQWLRRLVLSNMAVGDARVSLAFERHGQVTSFSLLRQDGDIAVRLAATPR